MRYRLVTRPLRTDFATSLGRKSSIRSVLVRVELRDGGSGTGEVPTSFTLPHETPRAIAGILREAARLLAGVPAGEHLPVLHVLRDRWPEHKMTLAGLEVALFRAQLADTGADELQHWGARQRSLETDLTLPFLPRDPQLDRWIAQGIAWGFRIFKLKVGGDPRVDLELARRVSDLLRDGLEQPVLRLDGNQGYTPRSFLRFVDSLRRARLSIELIEQPIPRDDWAGLRQLRGRSAVPIILDESVTDADQCRRVAEEELASGVNVKIAKSGITGSAEILAVARRAGLRLMMGCMTETMVGLSAGIRLAAGAGCFDYLDLDSIHFLHHRRVEQGITICGPRYTIP